MPSHHSNQLVRAVYELLSTVWHWLSKSVLLAMLLFSATSASATSGSAAWATSYFASHADCQDTIYNGSDGTDSFYAAGIMACALMVCGQAKNIDNVECDWFKRLSHQDDFLPDKSINFC